MEGNDFEYLLSKAGGLGAWQLKLFLFIGLNSFFMAFQHLGSVFLADTPDHWCRLPPAVHDFASRPNGTLERAKQIAIPLETWHGKERLSQCTQYRFNYTLFNSSYDEFSLYNRTESIEYCSEWEFDKSQYISTIVTEWNLVCSWKWMKSSVQASYMAGVLFGCLIFGFVSDRFGRRIALLISQVIFCSSSILASFAPEYVTFILSRFLTGISAPGVFGCPFVLITEIVDTKWRAIIGVYYQIPFGIGYAILPAIAYFLRDRQHLQLALSVPSVIILFSYWIVPESPRWLITQSRFEEALKILISCAKTNKRVLPPNDEVLNIMKELQKKEEASRSKETTVTQRLLITRLCSTMEMTKRTIAAYFTWFIVATVYYGFALNSPILGSDPYLVVFLGGILEIPAYLLGSLVITKSGRKITYCITFILAAIMCFCITFTPAELTWLISTFAVLGKFFITITFAISYLYTAELFPTVVRNIAVSYGSMMGRVGSISSPYIVYLLGHHYKTLPLILFGILSTVAGLIALILPETKNTHLVETVNEVQHPTVATNKSENANCEELAQLQPQC